MVETWASPFAFFLSCWGAGLAFAMVMHFGTFFVSTRWVEYWTGDLKD